jgi:hypothetical protein
MTTQAQLKAWRHDLEAARDRVERATWYGDHAGALIAGADARAIASRLRRAVSNDRQAAR